ncbi:CapA family protein [Agromyces sp. NPDC049794]|uniref:CapA family protein n=1 Tax=unclassified Agromyces TaxID=2639701 RepID=UPI0033F0E063
MSAGLTIVATGDLVLETSDPARLLEPTAGILRAADVAIGQLEIPHTEHAEVTSSDVPALPGDPAALAAVRSAGFDVLTMAGNHVADFGSAGVLDTRRHAEAAGLVVAGAGANLDEASRPAIVERGGRTVAVFSYNCVGPRETWAGSMKAGGAWVRVITHYEPQGANPGGPPEVYTFAERTSLDRMRADIGRAVADGHVVVVALHKGLVHVPARLADYEFEVSRAAIDAGASAVIGHHAHLMRGVELYRGAPIFHGLGNFATVTRALGGAADDAPERREWAERRRVLFGFEPDPAMPEYPFHPESRNTAIAVLDVDERGRVTPALIPCWIDDTARPVPVGRGDDGDRVADYLRRITTVARLGTTLHWDGDRLAVRSEDGRMSA